MSRGSDRTSGPQLNSVTRGGGPFTGDPFIETLLLVKWVS